MDRLERTRRDSVDMNYKYILTVSFIFKFITYVEGGWGKIRPWVKWFIAPLGNFYKNRGIIN